MKNFCAVLLLLCVFACKQTQEEQVNIDYLRCELKLEPQGIDCPNPRFSWEILAGETRGVVQTAYHILVASSLEKLDAGEGDLWDSKNVKSNASIHVPYGGKLLESRMECYWKVQITTNKGKSGWSSPSKWTMGLIKESDWQVKWIGLDKTSPNDVLEGNTRLPARYLRKEFDAKEKPVKATIYISGLGLYKLYLNGKRIGDQELSPTPTDYTKVVKYNTFDVTNVLAVGKNAVATTLGNGRFFAMRGGWMRNFGFPKMILQLELEYADGSRQTIASDNSWKITTDGPIRANNEFDGEEYDARREQGDWTTPGYDASQWPAADLMDAPGGRLTAQPADNLTVMESIKPVAIKPAADGKYILDMGQNMVGWLHIALRGRKDQPVTLRFAEMLKADGNELYVDNLRSARVTDVYTPARDGDFSWEPLFVYHGFRFVEIAGLDYMPATTAFTGKVVYDRMATAGYFETSNALVNRIHQNAYWGIRGNYRGMPTDCPQRDERLGWLGDRATGAHGESFIFDNHLLYAKWLNDIQESMNENSSISVVSPKFWTIYNDDVTWPSAFFYIADMLYRQFGDVRPIRTHYPAMKRWVQHQVDTQMQDFILTKDTYGDWCMPPESQELIHSRDPARKTSGQVLSTTVFFSILQLMSRFAEINDAPADAAEYLALATRIKEAYNRRYFDPATARYDNNTVTANILSLQLGLVPEGYEQKVFDNIVEKTETDFDGHVSTGVLGIQHLMRGLTEHNRLDLAYRIVTNESYPSWGYMVKKDATTIWELWNGDTADPAMNSANHVMLLGDLVIWFYENLGGIRNDPQSVGFKKILMQPDFPEGLNSVNARYASPYGLIESHWTRDGDRLQWSITIPANTTATVKLPARFNIATVDGAASDVTDADGISTLRLGSGSYRLQSK